MNVVFSLHKIYAVVISMIISPIEIFAESKGENPNIIFILVDDLGFSDLGFLGKKDVHTPNIDRLASQGMYFSNAYAASPVSSPTRASILTGRSPAELKITCHIPGVGMEKYITRMDKDRICKEAHFVDHLPENETTIASFLNERNYHTAFLGKWHLGGEGSQLTDNGVVNWSWLPDKYGFELNIAGCAYGQPASYFAPYRIATIKDGEDGEYLTDRLGDEAVNFISQNHPDKTGQPFFMYLSFYSVHTPFQAPQDVVSQNKGNKYYAMIQKMDENIGKVLKRLDDLDLGEKTIIIFYSDNGGIFENDPLSEKKGSIKEGGIRVPLLVRWDGIVKAGSICNEPVTSIDFYPTIAELSGDLLCKDQEACSLYPLFTGKSTTVGKRALYWHFPHHRFDVDFSMASAIRDGDWKLVQLFEQEEIYLYNLKDDLGETNNVFQANPQKGFELLEKLKKWQIRVNAEMPQRW